MNAFARSFAELLVTTVRTSKLDAIAVAAKHRAFEEATERALTTGVAVNGLPVTVDGWVDKLTVASAQVSKQHENGLGARTRSRGVSAALDASRLELLLVGARTAVLYQERQLARAGQVATHGDRESRAAFARAIMTSEKMIAAMSDTLGALNRLRPWRTQR